MKPEPTSRSRRAGQIAIAALGIGVAVATGVWMPAAGYRVTTAVDIDAKTGRPSAEAVRAAADLAVSNAVLVRAASALLASKVVPPRHGLLDGLFAPPPESAAQRAARWSVLLASSVRAAPSRAADALAISAQAPNAAQAVEITAAVAGALVAERDDMIVTRRHAREIDAETRLEGAKAAATIAHRRLADLEGAVPATTKTDAAGRTAAAAALVDAVRAVIASGSPPLGEGKDLPATVAALQTTYFDLSRKLAVARETLGDRHTTIIALTAGVRKASADLAAEWKRTLRADEDALASARKYEAALGAPATGDAARAPALRDAQQAAQLADDAVVAQASRPVDAADAGYHVVARAQAPAESVGWRLPQRILLSLLAGATAFLVALAAAPKRRRRAAAVTDSRPDPILRDERHAWVDEPMTEPVFALPLSVAPSFFDSDLAPPPQRAQSDAPANQREARDAVLPPLDEPPAPWIAELEALVARARDPQARPGERAEATMVSLSEIVAELAAIVPEAGRVPTVTVAADHEPDETMTVAYDLGRVAARQGMRVLLIEDPRALSRLDAADGPALDGVPMVAEVFGELRVVVEDEDDLFLAPALRNGRSLAAKLASSARTPLIDVAETFDLIVVDGRRARDVATSEWRADAYVRVGDPDSRRAADAFLDLVGAPFEALIGTVAAIAPAPQRVAPVAAAVAPTVPYALPSPRRAALQPAMRPAPRRPEHLAVPTRAADRRAIRAR